MVFYNFSNILINFSWWINFKIWCTSTT